MKKIIINISVLLILASCSIDKENSETENADSSEVIDSSKIELEPESDSLTIEPEPQSPDSLLSYFELLAMESLTVTIKNNTYSSYSKKKEIPLNYQPLFEGYLYPMERSSTGYLPTNYIQINDSISFLIVFIQDDYGPVYHGLEYDVTTNKISSSQILARQWGDAGDSQTIYSELKLQVQTLSINKFITTCHTELDFDSDPVKVISEECSDSTYVATIK